MGNTIRLLFSALLFMSISNTIEAQINTKAGGAAGVLANSPTTNTNVGIGTNTPKSNLDIKGNITVGPTYGGVTIAPVGGAIIEGNVGIGTSAPANKLHITSATAGTSGLRFTNLISTTAITTGLLGKALSVNATGDVVLVPVANADTDTSLYAADGTLASARTLTLGGNNLTFNPSTVSSQFFINGVTGNTGVGTITPATKFEVKSATAGTSGFRLTNLLSTSATTSGLTGKALSVNATGDVVLVPVANADTDTSLYAADGTLASARTLILGGNNLTFNPSTASSQFFINGVTGNTGIGNAAPTAKLEVTSGTAGDSGVKLTNLLSTSTTAASNGKALSVDATGKVILVPITASAVGVDATLTASGTLTMSGFNYTFNPSTASSQFFINGTTGNTGVGTITPATKFEVKSTTAGTSGFRMTNLLSTTAVTTGLLGKALSVNATGDVVLVPVANTDTDTSLYAADGTLASARTLTLGGNNLTFNPSTASSQFFINGTTGNTGIGNTAPTARLEVTSGTAGDSGVKLTNLTNASPTITGNNKALSVDASGNVVLVPVLSSATATTTLYTDNGTLTGVGDRIVSLAGKNLSFNSTSDSSFNINGVSGNVGIGTATPTATLEVKGNIKANLGEFSKSLPDGATFVDWKDRNKKSRVLNLGTLRDPLDDGRLLVFYDFPQSNVINTSKSAFYLNIDDRNNKTRFSTNADTGGEGHLTLLDKNQTEYLDVKDDGNDNFSMTMPKINSRVSIGTTASKGKLEIEGFPAINKTYTFLDYADSFAKSCILNIGTLRENENPSTSPGARLLTFSDVPPSNITASSQTMLAIEDRNNAT
jgi:hypothetical protein